MCWRWFGSCAIVIGALLASTITALAQADNGEPTGGLPPPVDLPPPPQGGPALACGVQLLRSDPSGVTRARFTCWVSGASSDDTSFVLEAVRLDDSGQPAYVLGPVGGDTVLAEGKGVCAGIVTDPNGGTMIGGLVIRGTLQPSGTPVGPVYVSPTP